MASLTKRQYDSGPNVTFTFKRNSSNGVVGTQSLSGYTITASGRFVGATTNSFTDRSLTVNSTANTALLAWSSDGGDFSSTGTLQLEFELTLAGRVERNPRWFDIQVNPSLSC